MRRLSPTSQFAGSQPLTSPVGSLVRRGRGVPTRGSGHLLLGGTRGPLIPAGAPLDSHA